MRTDADNDTASDNTAYSSRFWTGGNSDTCCDSCTARSKSGATRDLRLSVVAINVVLQLLTREPSGG